jgi:aldose sugar dehydrogenase
MTRLLLAAIATLGLLGCTALSPGRTETATAGQRAEAAPQEGTVSATHTTSAGPVAVTRVIGGLEVPWAIAFLPEGGFLVTERPGRLRHVRADGSSGVVGGVPAVHAAGQGGLLDVAVARDFAVSREIFLTYAEPRGGGTAATALAVGRLAPEGNSLERVRVIWRMQPATTARQHFGSRVVEAPDGSLFVTTGDRGDRDAAQDLTNHLGTLVRINRDGSVPADNPFVSAPNALADIWSYGLRNVQGAAIGLDGALWTAMHGPRGGDEINRHAIPGLNYGWPLQSFGLEYVTRRPIGRAAALEGVTAPLFWWRQSPAVSGLVVYSGRLFPAWRGALLVGALQHDTIIRLSGGTGGLREAERLLEGEFRRIRDVREAPDGSIWFIAETEGAVYRMAPAGPR